MLPILSFGGMAGTMTLRALSTLRACSPRVAGQAPNNLKVWAAGGWPKRPLPLLSAVPWWPRTLGTASYSRSITLATATVRDRSLVTFSAGILVSTRYLALGLKDWNFAKRSSAWQQTSMPLSQAPQRGRRCWKHIPQTNRRLSDAVASNPANGEGF